MKPTGKKVAGLVAVVVILLGIMWAWSHFHPPQPPVTVTPTKHVGDFDQFQQDLADRVRIQYGGGSDFTAIVATTAYPLGTLLRPTGSVPADLEDCVPAVAPTPFAAQHLFPSYSMSRDTALTANLGSGALQGLDGAGVSLEQSQNIQYTIQDTQIQIMDDKSVEQVTRQGNCGKYIASHPGMRLIRGTVFGKMTFTAKFNNPAAVKAELAKIGQFRVSDNPGSTTQDIADEERQPIVQMLSEFGAGTTPAAAIPIPKPLAPAGSAGGPAASNGPAPPHIFVQMDAGDSPASGTTVVQLLRNGWPTANVESKVQRIPTGKMPNTAQVRYFNEADTKFADRCVEILQKAYPGIRVVRIGLTSPNGQLEVWLPKLKP